MEQSAIYDLLLDEQKESLHYRVASYLEQAMKNFGDSAHSSQSIFQSTDHFEQGFHWEKAKVMPMIDRVNDSYCMAVAAHRTGPQRCQAITSRLNFSKTQVKFKYMQT
jgi:hypothetical protein